MLNKQIIFFFTLFTSCVFGSINTNDYLKEEGFKELNESLIIPISDEALKNKWEFAFSDEGHGGSYVLEFIPKGEKIESWSQLIQIQYFPLSSEMKNKINAEIFADHFLKALKTHLPDVTIEKIKNEPNLVLLEWKLPKQYLNENPQNEIATILSTDTGLFRAAYTQKVPDLSQETRNEWIEILSHVEVKN